eukprot:6568756-Pyramimonas_sp.AAC.1
MQEAWVYSHNGPIRRRKRGYIRYSHDGPIRRRKCGYILTTDQLGAGSMGIFSPGCCSRGSRTRCRRGEARRRPAKQSRRPPSKPIRFRKRGYILLMDQSDAGRAGIFSQRPPFPSWTYKMKSYCTCSRRQSQKGRDENIPSPSCPPP